MPVWITARSYGGYDAINIPNQFSVSASSSQSVSVTEVVPYQRRSIALVISGPVSPVLDPTSQIPQTIVSRWYEPLSEPKRFKPGLNAAEQQFLANEQRPLPKPNVTMTMSATEKDTDIAAIGVVAVDNTPVIDQTAVKVSISEMPGSVDSSARVSIVETEEE